MSAVGSPSGGAAAIIELCERGLVEAVVSDSVVEEAERNVAKKVKRVSVHALHEIIQLARVRIIKLRDLALVEASSINDKDKHVYVAAMSIQVDYVITHDRALIREITQQGGVIAMTPGDFLQQVGPHLARR